jgi:hypothetical protein
VPSTPDYAVLSQVHSTWWDAALQTATEGWIVTIQDRQTGTVIPLKIPDAYWTAGAVSTYAAPALANVRANAQPGTIPPAASSG